jgi:hypothetical protein
MERFVWEETIDRCGRAHKQAMQPLLPWVSGITQPFLTRCEPESWMIV